MHRGRGGRRVNPPCLSIDATPPYWMPYYQRPLPTLFTFSGFPIFGPVGAPYRRARTQPGTANVIFGYRWTDPVTTFTFFSYLLQQPIYTAPGVRFQWGILHPTTGGRLGGSSDHGPLGTFWDIIGTSGDSVQYGPATTMTGLFFAIDNYQSWKAASWHEEPA